MQRDRRIGTVFRPLGLLLLAAALLFGCAQAPVRPAAFTAGDYRYLADYLAWFVPRQMDQYGVTGLSLALVDGERVVLARGFGWADAEARVPATAETVYRAASLTKPLTATAVMQLVEQGRVRLDAPLTDYVPDFSIRSHQPLAGPITVRTLLTHHAGLPTFRLKDFWRAVPLEQLRAELQREYLAFPPQTVHNYSNLGYDLLGLLLERLGGQPYAAYMEQELLVPLGMTHSAFGLNGAMRPRMAQGYRNGEPYTEPAEGRDLPAGGLHSTVLDLSRFLRMVLGGGHSDGTQLLAPQTVAAMLERQPPAPLDLDARYGLGWFLGNRWLDYAGRTAGHSGATIAFRSRMLLLPERGLGVVVLSNSSTANPAIGNIAIEALKLAIEIKFGLTPPAPPAAAPPAFAANPLLAGRYASSLGLVEIRRNGAELEAEVAGRILRLARQPDGGLRLEYRLFGFIPVRLSPSWRDVRLSLESLGGEEALIGAVDGRRVLLGVRTRSQPLPAAWRARLGDYEVLNQDGGDMRLDRFRLEERDGLLLLATRVPDLSEDITAVRVLTPLDERAAVLAGYGRGLGETVEAVAGPEGERLRYSGLMLRRR